MGRTFIPAEHTRFYFLFLCSLLIFFSGPSPLPVRAQWDHCNALRQRVLEAAQASNIPLVNLETSRYEACIRGVPIPPGPRNAPRQAAPQGRWIDTTMEEMNATNINCGSDGNAVYFCPRTKVCDPNRLGKCLTKAEARRSAGKPAFEAKRGRVCNLDSNGVERCVNKKYN